MSLDPASFTTDGCSGGISIAWRKLYQSAPPWEDCCIAHDEAYWRGGDAADRRQADARLLACIALNGHPLIAIVLWIAVRIGGGPYWPHRYRWGNGQNA